MDIETSVCRPAFMRTTLHMMGSVFLLAAFVMSSNNCETSVTLSMDYLTIPRYDVTVSLQYPFATFAPFRGAGIKRTGLNVSAVSCRVSAMLASGDHGQPQACPLLGAFLFPTWQDHPAKRYTLCISGRSSQNFFAELAPSTPMQPIMLISEPSG
jgi:hypothetical protein